LDEKKKRRRTGDRYLKKMNTEARELKEKEEALLGIERKDLP